jgi:hypothetical protein
LTDVSEVLTRELYLMVEAIGSSEISVNFYQTTQRYIPDDSHLYVKWIEETRRR